MRAMVNLTGGYGKGLADAVNKYDRAYPDRFFTFTEPHTNSSKIRTIPGSRVMRSSRPTKTALAV